MSAELICLCAPAQIKIRKSASLRKMTDMKRNRNTEERIIWFLKQAEVGMPVNDLCPKEGISDATFSKWLDWFLQITSVAPDAKREHLGANLPTIQVSRLT
jgi:hypothetical protein